MAEIDITDFMNRPVVVFLTSFIQNIRRKPTEGINKITIHGGHYNCQTRQQIEQANKKWGKDKEEKM